jgi:hypothetical protein
MTPAARGPPPPRRQSHGGTGFGPLQSPAPASVVLRGRQGLTHDPTSGCAPPRRRESSRWGPVPAGEGGGGLSAAAMMVRWGLRCGRAPLPGAVEEFGPSGVGAPPGRFARRSAASGRAVGPWAIRPACAWWAGRRWTRQKISRRPVCSARRAVVAAAVACGPVAPAARHRPPRFRARRARGPGDPAGSAPGPVRSASPDRGRPPRGRSGGGSLSGSQRLHN